MRPLLLLVAMVAPIAASGATLEASRAPLDLALARDGWHLEAVAGRPVARFSAEPDGTIAISADHAVGFLARGLSVDERASPGRPLAWRWRVDAAPPASDLSRAEGDDRPLAVHVIFPAPRGEGLFATLRRQLTAAIAGPLFSGRVLTYVWGGVAAAGTVLPNAYLPDDGRLIVRRGPEAPLGTWLAEAVDVDADYRATFGFPPSEPPTAIAISSDTDDRGGVARAQIVPPRFDAPR
jgi:hypothetical protein